METANSSTDQKSKFTLEIPALQNSSLTLENPFLAFLKFRSGPEFQPAKCKKKAASLETSQFLQRFHFPTMHTH